MYRPKAFDVAEVAGMHALIEAAGAADLVTMSGSGLVSSVVPLLLEPEIGVFGRLSGHLARGNPQWRDLDAAVEALVIFRGPDAYISPSWLATKALTHEVVPTWNYEVVHAHGRLVVHDDPEWVGGLVRRLTERHESGRQQPWAVEDAPAPYIAKNLRRIVGIELEITRLEGKRKLSQNRGEDDVAGVIAGLRADGSSSSVAVADAMAAVVDRGRGVAP